MTRDNHFWRTAKICSRLLYNGPEWVERGLLYPSIKTRKVIYISPLIPNVITIGISTRTKTGSARTYYTQTLPIILGLFLFGALEKLETFPKVLFTMHFIFSLKYFIWWIYICFKISNLTGLKKKKFKPLIHTQWLSFFLVSAIFYLIPFQ